MNTRDPALPSHLSVFDVHTHIGTYEREYFPAMYIEQLCDVFPIEAVAWAPFSWDEGLRHLRDGDEMASPLLHTARAMKWLWVSPVREEGLAILARKELPPGYCGIKLHPSLDQYDLMPLLVTPVIDAAERWSVPVAIHTGNRGCSAGIVASCFPRRPACPIILFHSRPIDEAVSTAQSLDTALLELSFSSAADVCRAHDTLGPDRIVFGSDYPIGAMYYRGLDVLSLYRRRLLELLEHTERLGITATFFHRNARRLFEHGLRETP